MGQFSLLCGASLVKDVGATSPWIDWSIPLNKGTNTVCAQKTVFCGLRHIGLRVKAGPLVRKDGILEKNHQYTNQKEAREMDETYAETLTLLTWNVLRFFLAQYLLVWAIMGDYSRNIHNVLFML